MLLHPTFPLSSHLHHHRHNSSSSSSSSPPSPSPLFSHSSFFPSSLLPSSAAAAEEVIQVGEEVKMDYPASSAALRRGGSPQHNLSTPGYYQHQYEDVWSLDKSAGHVVGEDFSIDDLLNFSSMPDEALDQPPSKEEFGEEKAEEDDHGYNSNSSSGFSLDEPILPAGDISDLEWVSQIVDDSFVVDPPCSAMPPAYFHHLTTTATKNHSRSPSSVSITSGFTSMKRTFTFSDNTVEVPSKARSKRARTGGRARSFHHLQLPEPMSCSSVSSSSSCSSASSPSSCLIFEPKSPNQDVVAAPVVVHRGRGRPPLHKKKSEATTATNIYQQALPTKQHKKKGRKPKAMRPMPAEHHGTATADGVMGRRCSHCGVQKTPQWRAGPLGAKTLCNACGVRYKSGRLLPEYRPAISPTFLDHVHSNSHRKVLEMRRKKELLAHQQLQQRQLLDIGDSAATGPR